MRPDDMPTDQPPDLFERSFTFACDVYDYCEDLVRLRGLPCRLAYQLFDAAGSVGATAPSQDRRTATKSSRQKMPSA